jgi:protease IV
MKTHTSPLLSVLVLAVALPIGCGPSGGILIKPVPANQRLQESVVASDKGLLVLDKVAVVDLDGLIMNDRSEGFFGGKENPVAMFVEKLQKATDDPSVCAVIVRINSPGGGVTASDIAYQRLLRFRQERKVPVVAVIEDVGASGGFYVACGADRIIAHPTAVTGSIGVIMQTFSLAKSLEKLGISTDAITSGNFKDMGSPLKPLAPADRKLIQDIVNEFYNRFVDVVAKGRPKLTAEQVRTLADGRVYSGQQALANGLVDQVGTVDDAVAFVKQQTGRQRVKVVMYHRPLGYRGTVYSESPSPAPQMNLVNFNVGDLTFFSRPQFLYLWTGHAE